MARSRCCLRAAATGGSLCPTAANRHEQESPDQAIACALSGFYFKQPFRHVSAMSRRNAPEFCIVLRHGKHEAHAIL
jgi:hypothetical protein